jgi:hypothetical protein
MASTASLRDALKVRLATIAGLRTHDTWPDTINPPAAIVMPRSSPPKQTFSGTYKHQVFEIVVAVQQGTLRTAQDALDDYWSDTGASSIEAAVLGDPTLGGLALGIVRFEGTDYGAEISVGDATNELKYGGCRFECEVMVE